jgi:hypothetical protein
MSVLRLQSLEPIVGNTAVAVLSFTSSGGNCCKTEKS